jgi:hypothetical protein
LYGDDPFNAGWLLAVTATLREHEDWGLGINKHPAQLRTHLPEWWRMR